MPPGQTPPFVRKALGTPAQYPPELLSWLTKVISGNKLFQISIGQLAGIFPNDATKFLNGAGSFATILASQVTNAADKSSGSQQAFAGEIKTPDLVVAGLTGATAVSRYVGATASGAPASGTFAVGDFVIDQSGSIWVCTAAGTPGTWAHLAPTTSAPGAEIAYDQITANVNITGTVVGSATTVIAGSAHTYDGGPVLATFSSPAIILPAVAGGLFTAVLFEGGTPLAYMGQWQNPAAAAHWEPFERAFRFTPSAGSHTYSIKCFVSSTTGTPAVGAGAGGSATAPAFLRITKV